MYIHHIYNNNKEDLCILIIIVFFSSLFYAMNHIFSRFFCLNELVLYKNKALFIFWCLFFVVAKLLIKRLYIMVLPCLPQELWNQINSYVWSFCRDSSWTGGTYFHHVKSFKNRIISLCYKLFKFSIYYCCVYYYSNDLKMYEFASFFFISFDNTLKSFEDKRYCLSRMKEIPTFLTNIWTLFLILCRDFAILVNWVQVGYLRQKM